MRIKPDQFERQKGVGGVVIVVTIALIALVGGYLFFRTQQSNADVVTTMNNSVRELSPTAAAPVVTGASGVTSPTDVSDTALDKDTVNINAKFNAAGTDSTNADAGLSATPEALQ